ncbi:MAG: hypothetical protein JWO63_535 [Frankiales bacterium]|jgi:hypothetical protein|nr:hypothetical protein [Frankiales bacterium]
MTASENNPHHQASPLDEEALLRGAVRAARPGLTRAAVSASYLGGSSEHWRRFLLALAQQPEQWVTWSSLYAAVGRSDRQCRDIVHRAERRGRGWPPYVRAYRSGWAEGGTVDYWMPAEVAALVVQLATARPPGRGPVLRSLAG